MEEKAKTTDLPENKIQDVIATVHKAIELAVAIGKEEVVQPAEEPTTQFERLKEQEPKKRERKKKENAPKDFFKKYTPDDEEQ